MLPSTIDEYAALISIAYVSVLNMTPKLLFEVSVY
jgi:hypothetical protein